MNNRRLLLNKCFGGVGVSISYKKGCLPHAKSHAYASDLSMRFDAKRFDAWANESEPLGDVTPRALESLRVESLDSPV
jgi:hypothetical protein